MTQDFKSPRPVIVHYPPSTYMGESVRRSVVGDLPGVRLPREIALLQDHYSMHDGPKLFPGQGTKLSLRLLNKVTPELFVFVYIACCLMFCHSVSNWVQKCISALATVLAILKC